MSLPLYRKIGSPSDLPIVSTESYLPDGLWVLSRQREKNL